MVEAYTVATEMKPVTRRLPSTMENVLSSMNPLATTLQDDQKDDETAFQKQQRELLLQHKDLNKHAINVDESALKDAFHQSIKKQQDISNITISVPKSRDNKGSEYVTKLPELTYAEQNDRRGEETPKKNKKDKKRSHDQSKSADESISKDTPMSVKSKKQKS